MEKLMESKKTISGREKVNLKWSKSKQEKKTQRSTQKITISMKIRPLSSIFQVHELYYQITNTPYYYTNHLLLYSEKFPIFFPPCRSFFERFLENHNSSSPFLLHNISSTSSINFYQSTLPLVIYKSTSAFNRKSLSVSKKKHQPTVVQTIRQSIIITPHHHIITPNNNQYLEITTTTTKNNKSLHPHNI